MNSKAITLLNKLFSARKWWRKNYWAILFVVFVLGVCDFLYVAQRNVIERATLASATRHPNIQWGLPLEPHFGAPPFLAWAGKDAQILFFSPTCGHCLKTLPHFLKIPGKQLILIAVKSSTNKDLQAARDNLKINVPVYRDTDGQFAAWFGLTLVPTLVSVHGSNTTVGTINEAISDSLASHP
jgi:thiol-disulfide isomerase/thioredoxin